VYLGSPKVNAFLPGMEDAVIRVADFPSPQALAEYLKRVAADETLYAKFHAWRDRFRGYEGTTMAGAYSNVRNLFCNLCDRVRQDPHAHRGRIKAEVRWL